MFLAAEFVKTFRGFAHAVVTCALLALAADIVRAESYGTLPPGVSCAAFDCCEVSAASTNCSADVCGDTKKCNLPAGGVRPQDQVFLLSTRNLGCGYGDERPNWQVWLRSESRWLNSDSDAIFAPQNGARTVVYVHGNRVDSEFAVEGGLRVYNNLVTCADEGPIRFVIWSWCADQIRRPIRDVRVKADVANGQGVLFGRFLARFEQQDHVGLIGFSYGCRIITAGVHLLGGGSWCGYRIADEHPPQLHVVLWAAAEGSTWLLPNGQHGKAVPICGDWLIAKNCCDKALLRYDIVDAGAEALGCVGLNPEAWGDLAAGIRQMQVSHLVGCEHVSRDYPESPSVMAAARAVVLRPAPLTIEPLPTVAAP